jgi:hypothetical protein
MSNPILLDDFKTVPDALAKELGPWFDKTKSHQATLAKEVTKVMLYVTLNPLSADAAPQVLKTGANPAWSKKPDHLVKYQVNQEGHLEETSHHDSLKDLLPKIYAATSVKFTAKALPTSDTVLAEKGWVYQLRVPTAPQTPA